MLTRILTALAAALAAYFAFALLGGWLVSKVSANAHDRELEAAMTGAFACGPLGALAAFVLTFVLLRSRARP